MPVTTLTLHHILPYLPFGLRMTSHGREYEINGFLLESALFVQDKPLLYSLDDYRTHPGGGDMIKYQIYLLAIGEMELGQVCYAAIQAMAEAHIDFHRLIDADLAVKKEPLNRGINPYNLE